MANNDQLLEVMYNVAELSVQNHMADLHEKIADLQQEVESLKRKIKKVAKDNTPITESQIQRIYTALSKIPGRKVINKNEHKVYFASGDTIMVAPLDNITNIQIAENVNDDIKKALNIL